MGPKVQTMQTRVTWLAPSGIHCDSAWGITRRCLLVATALAINLFVLACASKPLVPYSTESSPLVLVPVNEAGVQDKRGRFREIYCAVLEGHGHDLPDYRACEDALTRVGAEPAGSGRAVDLGPSQHHLVAAVVPGIGYDCIASWLAPAGTIASHVRKYGYDLTLIKVDALSSTSRNARQIRDAIMAMDMGAGEPSLVLIGYSKGAPDVLEAILCFVEEDLALSRR